MALDLTELAKDVARSIESYETPERPAGAAGSPLPRDWFEDNLKQMRAALIPPHWIQIRDQDPASGALVVLTVAAVTEEPNGYVVAYDPATEGEFVLAIKDLDPDRSRAVNFVACGGRGAAVDCFLAH